MQIRLISYLVLLILSALAAFIFFGIAFGLFSITEDRICERMEQQLDNLYNDMVEERNHMEGYAHALSAELAGIIEAEAGSCDPDMEELNDQPARLQSLQEEFYSEISSTLQLARASGAFAVLDATTNTGAPGSEDSRSGLYLRLYNISSEYTMNPRFLFFRGIPEVARKRGTELHNRWNLEFDVRVLPGYRELLEGGYGKPSDGSFWCSRMKLPETWENVILYQVPILGSQGHVYGSCGVEYSEILFKDRHQAFEERSGTLVSVIAPVSESRLFLGAGMIGDAGEGGALTGENLEIKRGRSFDIYKGAEEEYIGMHRIIPFQGRDDQKWAAAVLMPQWAYAEYELKNRLAWIAVAMAFLAVMIALAVFMSRRYVMPIKSGIEAIKEGNSGNVSSDIREIAELLEFVSRKENEGSGSGGLPPNIAELFDSFAERVRTLTAAEHNIFMYYVQGREISEIPDLVCVSINTVRKHNRSIYEKLKVASKDELMLYVELFQRCGRLDDLLYPSWPDGTEKSDPQQEP
ncbi:MAG: helix-turn-helix transcriptional regulator [Anaerovoracaceae bacterium]